MKIHIIRSPAMACLCVALAASCVPEPLPLHTLTQTSSSSTGTGGAGTGGTGTGGTGTGGTGGGGTSSAGGGGAASGGAGGGGVCSPGSSMACYTGPPGTQDIGLCIAGSKTCNAMGTDYGPCMGEVLPSPETCATPGDDDCNGMTNEGGVDCTCAPGSTAPCYSGPPGTENVGPCTGGLATCNAMGTGYGACTGEVLPQPEKCATPVDEDCDGATPPCLLGPHIWSKAFGGLNNQDGVIALDGSGNIVMAGAFTSSADFGGGLLVSAGPNDMFVVKLDPNGNHLWSKRFGGTGADTAAAVALAPGGEIVVTGSFEATVDFGGGPLTSPSGSSAFALKLDAGGNHLWSKTFGGGTNSDIGRAVAIDGTGHIVLVADLGGTMSFGGAPLLCAGSTDVAVAKLTAAGDHIWSKRFGDSDYQHARGLTLDAAGNVLLAGRLTGSITFGGSVLMSAGSGDAFVAKLDTAGAHVYSKRFGDATDQWAQALAVDGSGNVVVGGALKGTLDLGGGPLVAVSSQDVFVGKLDSSGAHVWSKRFGAAGGNNSYSLTRVAVDGIGSLIMTGTSFGPLDLGGGPLPGPATMFVGKLDASAAHVWSKSFGVSVSPYPRSVAVDSGGGSVIGGVLTNTVDFGGGQLSPVDFDVFVVKLGP